MHPDSAATQQAPIRVGIIGATADPSKSWGTRAHIPALARLPGFRLSAVCTSAEATARETAARHGVPHAFWDPRELAASKDVDLVVISVRTPLHKQMIDAAVEGRKHVYCEWPLGLTTGEARA